MTIISMFALAALVLIVFALGWVCGSVNSVQEFTNEDFYFLKAQKNDLERTNRDLAGQLRHMKANSMPRTIIGFDPASDAGDASAYAFFSRKNDEKWTIEKIGFNDVKKAKETPGEKVAAAINEAQNLPPKPEENMTDKLIKKTRSLYATIGKSLTEECEQHVAKIIEHGRKMGVPATIK